MTEWLEFDVHGLAAIRVARDSPGSGRFQELFAPFTTSGLRHHDLTVVGAAERLVGASRTKWRYRYTDDAVESRTDGWSVRRAGTEFRIGGAVDLLPVALPLLDRVLTTRGAALVNAAGVDLDGAGVCLGASGGTGKTSAVAALSRLPRASFMGDDLVLLSEEGLLLGFPKRILMKSHHRELYRDGFRRARRVALPYRLTHQWLQPRLYPLLRSHPRIRERVKRFSPILPVVPITAEEALGIPTRLSTGLNLLVMLQLHEADQLALSKPGRGALVSRLVGQFYSDVLTESHDVIATLAATGLLPIDSYFAEKAAVLDHSLRKAPFYLMRIPARLAKEQAAAMIAQKVVELVSLRSGRSSGTG